MEDRNANDPNAGVSEARGDAIREGVSEARGADVSRGVTQGGDESGVDESGVDRSSVDRSGVDTRAIDTSGNAGGRAPTLAPGGGVTPAASNAPGATPGLAPGGGTTPAAAPAATSHDPNDRPAPGAADTAAGKRVVSVVTIYSDGTSDTRNA